jgi:hypothetical protein
MKKILTILIASMMVCSNSNSDHQVDHWVNLVCKYDDGSGNIEIKFDKKKLIEINVLKVEKIKEYKIIKKNNSEVIAEIYLYTNDKHVYYINRTTGTWIKEQKIRDPDDSNSNEYGTYSTYYGTCKVKTQAF